MESVLYSFCSLVVLYHKLNRFMILHDSWIKTVRAHFPWSILYIQCSSSKTNQHFLTNLSTKTRHVNKCKKQKSRLCTLTFYDFPSYEHTSMIRKVGPGSKLSIFYKYYKLLFYLMAKLQLLKNILSNRDTYMTPIC